MTDPPRFIVQLKSANGAGKVAAAAVELAAAVAGTNVKLLSPDLGMYTVEASKGVNPLEILAALKRTPGEAAILVRGSCAPTASGDPFSSRVEATFLSPAASLTERVRCAAVLSTCPAGVVFAEVDARVQLNAGSRTNYVYLKPRDRPNAPPPPPPAPFPNDPLYLAKRQWGVVSPGCTALTLHPLAVHDTILKDQRRAAF